jgi:hypothetical protein
MNDIDPAEHLQGQFVCGVPTSATATSPQRDNHDGVGRNLADAQAHLLAHSGKLPRRRGAEAAQVLAQVAYQPPRPDGLVAHLIVGSIGAVTRRHEDVFIGGLGCNLARSLV